MNNFQVADPGVLEWLQGNGQKWLPEASPEVEAALSLAVQALREYCAHRRGERAWMDASNLINYMRLAAEGRDLSTVRAPQMRRVGDPGCTPGVELF